MPTKLPQDTIDRIADEANIYVEWKFNGGVSPTTEAHCLDCYIAAATLYETRAIELVNALEWISKVTNNPEIGMKCDKVLKNYKKQ